jgi:hypothetical protein
MQTTLDRNSIDAIAEILDQYQLFLELGMTSEDAKEALLDALTTPVGGYQAAAHLLHVLTGRTYSRQAAQGLHTRRNDNSFPDKQQFRVISSKMVEVFNLNEVEAWQKERAAGKDTAWR